MDEQTCCGAEACDGDAAAKCCDPREMVPAAIIKLAGFRRTLKGKARDDAEDMLDGLRRAWVIACQNGPRASHWLAIAEERAIGAWRWMDVVS